VEVPKLQDVQFDSRNRLIITGRARIKAAPDAPSIENGFKLRTKIGTRANGRIIGLLEPEIAVFAGKIERVMFVFSSVLDDLNASFVC
jgi:hypothetical protein